MGSLLSPVAHNVVGAYTAPVGPPTAPVGVTFQLPMDQAEGSTTFTDQSLDARTVTVVGGTEHDDSQSINAPSSARFYAAGDRLEVANSGGLLDHSQDWTIETFVRLNVLPGNRAMIFAVKDDGVDNGMMIAVMSDGSPRVYGFNTGGTVFSVGVSGSAPMGSSVWRHVAIVHDVSSKTLTVYSGGVEHASGTYTGTIGNSGSNLWIGEQDRAAGTYPITGRLGPIRFYMGTKVYTAAFTPPSAAFPAS